MAIINLGSGEARKSPLAGLGEFTSDLVERRERRKISREAETGRNKRAADTNETSLQMKLAGIQATKADKLRAGNNKALQNFSNLTSLEQENFLLRDKGNFAKNLKVTHPQNINEKGEIIPLPNTRAAFQPKTREEALQFLKESEEIIAKVKADQPLSQAEAVGLNKYVATNRKLMAFGLMPQDADFTAILDFLEDKANRVLGATQKEAGGNNFTSSLSSGDTGDSNDPFGFRQ